MQIYVFLIGTCLGSFLPCICSQVMHHNYSMRSRCDYCHHIISPIYLLPIVGYYLTKGHCHYCGKQLSMFYPIFEAFMGLFFLFVFRKFVIV